MKKIKKSLPNNSYTCTLVVIEDEVLAVLIVVTCTLTQLRDSGVRQILVRHAATPLNSTAQSATACCERRQTGGRKLPASKTRQNRVLEPRLTLVCLAAISRPTLFNSGLCRHTALSGHQQKHRSGPSRNGPAGGGGGRASNEAAQGAGGRGGSAEDGEKRDS